MEEAFEESDAENQDAEPESEERGSSIKDLKLPETTVVKLMKEHLPKNAIIAQEAKDAMRRMSTIFALFITDQALTIAKKNKRRTILPEDVAQALEENDFSRFAVKVLPVVARRRANFKSQKPKNPNPVEDSEPEVSDNHDGGGEVAQENDGNVADTTRDSTDEESESDEEEETADETMQSVVDDSMKDSTGISEE